MKCNVAHRDTSLSADAPPGIAIGVDWGDSQHAFAIGLPDGSIETGSLIHSSESLHHWLNSLRLRVKQHDVALILEVGSVALIAALREHPWVRLYTVCPFAPRAPRMINPMQRYSFTCFTLNTLDLKCKRRSKSAAGGDCGNWPGVTIRDPLALFCSCNPPTVC